MDLLFNPFLRTVFVLILPCAVIFLIVRLILLNLAIYNRRLDQHRMTVEEQRQADAALLRAEEQDAANKACITCGTILEEDKSFCSSCGSWIS